MTAIYIDRTRAGNDHAFLGNDLLAHTAQSVQNVFTAATWLSPRDPS